MAGASFSTLSADFDEYDRISDATGLLLLVDRDIAAIRSDFTAFIQSGNENQMEAVEERTGNVDRDIQRLRQDIVAADRRELLEQVAGLFATLKNQIAEAGDLRRRREVSLTDFDAVGSRLRRFIAASVESRPNEPPDADDSAESRARDALNAMELMMRARVAVLRFVAVPDGARRKGVEELLDAFDKSGAKLQLPPVQRQVLDAEAAAFRSGFRAAADATQALYRTVDDTADRMARRASETTARLRSLQAARIDALRDHFATRTERGIAFIGGVSLAALVAATGSALLVSGMVTAPMRAMAEAAQAASGIGEIVGLASHGDLRNRVTLDGTRSGFARVIGGHLNELFDRFAATLHAIRRMMATLAEGTASAATAAAHAQSGAHRQATELEKVRDALRLSARAVTEATDNARAAGITAESANQLANDSVALARRLVDNIETIAAGGRQVGQVTATIGDIAQRTGILAATTAIEVAREGGTGGVFAVIAEQVNALSEACAAAARRISATIAESTVATGTGIATATEMRGTAERLVEQVSRTDATLRGAYEALLSQQSSSVQVSATVEHLVEIVARNAEATNEVARILGHLQALGQETASTVATFQLSDREASG
jgi:methyl-accepting chemotaxis protein